MNAYLTLPQGASRQSRARPHFSSPNTRWLPYLRPSGESNARCNVRPVHELSYIAHALFHAHQRIVNVEVWRLPRQFKRSQARLVCCLVSTSHPKGLMAFLIEEKRFTSPTSSAHVNAV